MWQIESPVLAIFGTSSQQGKFSLQIELRKRFLHDGYKLKQISTEPMGYFFGMDYTCPIEFNGSIELKDSELTKFFNLIMHKCNQSDTDMIMVGGQSSILHHSLYNEKYFRLLRNRCTSFINVYYFNCGVSFFNALQCVIIYK